MWCLKRSSPHLMFEALMWGMYVKNEQPYQARDRNRVVVVVVVVVKRLMSGRS